MALSDIPSKIIEKAGTLSEKKMEIAFNLTQLIHKENKDEQKVLDTFSHCLDLIKEFLPQDQATHLMPPQAKNEWMSQRSKLLLLALGGLITIIFVFYIFLHFVGIKALIQLLGLGAVKNTATN